MITRELAPTYDVLPNSGGSAISAFLLCKFLSENGIHVNAIFPSSGSKTTITKMDSNLRLILIPFLSERFVGSYPFSFFLRYKTQIFDCSRIIKIIDHYSLNPDLIHIEHKMMGATKLKKDLKTPIIVTVRDYWPVCATETMFDGEKACQLCNSRKMLKCLAYNDPYLLDFHHIHETLYKVMSYPLRILLAKHVLTFKKSALQNADKILVNSYFMKKTLQKTLDFAHKKVDVIYPPAPSFPYVNPLDKENDRKIFTYIGWLSKAKGIVNLLHAFSKAITKKREIRLRIFGRGPLEKYVIKYIVTRKLHRNITFEGYLKHTLLTKVLKETDVVVVPSLWPEPFGRVCMEAMVCGRPVIINPTGGLIEQVRDGVNGFHVNCYDINSFADKILEVANMSRDRLIKMGRRARKYALKKFNAKKQIKKLIKIYEEVLGS